MNMAILINLVYVVASVLFILGLKMLSHPDTARRGNMLSGIGMLMAVIVTLLDQQIVEYQYIVAATVVAPVPPLAMQAARSARDSLATPLARPSRSSCSS